MKRIICILIALSLAAVAAQAQSLVAGAAKVDITPKQSDLQFASDIIRGRLYVRAIYASDGHSATALVAMDTHCHDLDATIRKASASTGVPYENFVISSTHTHSGGTTGIGPDNIPTQLQIQEAIVSAVQEAKASARPARVGFGKRPLDLNVNRDNYNEFQEWEQASNWTAPSDKDLTVITFLDQEDVPIAVYMNYGMHPVNFFISGVVSADFPGDACALIEKVFGGNTVAVFCQGASGDQNPKLAYSDIFKETSQVKGVRLPKRAEVGAIDLRPKEVTGAQVPLHKAMVDRKDEYVRMLGNAVGFKALEIMLYDTQYEENPVIKGAETVIAVPGRERIDKVGRENYDPGYKPAGDVHIGVGLVTIGDIALVSVSGEIYTEIGFRLKREFPASKLMVVTLADGPFESGYIYSDNAANHLTFQVIGSRLQPGYAEKGIVEAAKQLMKEAK